MAKSIKPQDLGAAIAQDLSIYHEQVVEKIDKAGDEAMKKLVKQTKATAPVGKTGSFKKHITSKVLAKGPRGSTRVWYVKAPDHRLTHLLANGHATKDGGRTKANPFLRNAVDAVLPEYAKAVEEAIKK